MQTAIVVSPPADKAALVALLQQLAQRNLVQQAAVTEIADADNEMLMGAVDDVLRGEQPSTDAALKRQELRALTQAAANGYPASGAHAAGIPTFEVISAHVRSVALNGVLDIRVCPVSRLRVVLVQTGYRRLAPDNILVDRAYRPGDRVWYPGVELFGEGIFLDIADAQQVQHLNDVLLGARGGMEWERAYQNPAGFGFGGLDVDALYQLHPLFVWWHTLAHRVINAISIDSGYNAASIRERVYVDTSGATPRGGILIYTAQPGGDGTLGGLISLTNQFGSVLQRALFDLDSCSNDPLCEEEHFAAERVNGSGCYACLFLSETSCEHRNMFLDRHVLRLNA